MKLDPSRTSSSSFKRVEDLHGKFWRINILGGDEPTRTLLPAFHLYLPCHTATVRTVRGLRIRGSGESPKDVGSSSLGRPEGTAEGAAYTPQRTYVSPSLPTCPPRSFVRTTRVYISGYVRSFREMISYSPRKRVRTNRGTPQLEYWRTRPCQLETNILGYCMGRVAGYEWGRGLLNPLLLKGGCENWFNWDTVR